MTSKAKAARLHEALAARSRWLRGKWVNVLEVGKLVGFGEFTGLGVKRSPSCGRGCDRCSGTKEDDAGSTANGIADGGVGIYTCLRVLVQCPWKVLLLAWTWSCKLDDALKQAMALFQIKHVSGLICHTLNLTKHK